MYLLFYGYVGIHKVRVLVFDNHLKYPVFLSMIYTAVGYPFAYGVTFLYVIIIIDTMAYRI